MKEIVLGTVVVVLAATGVRAADFTAAIDHNWHQWRGPAANGVAPHADPPVRWDETTHIKWKVPIPGRGTSTPIVWQDQVFVLSAVETDRGVATLAEPKAVPPGGYKTLRPMKLHQFLILSFDRETGRLRWSRIANETLPHEGHHGNHGYASASPTTDGRRLYVSYGSRGVYAYDLNGKRLWKRDLGEMITRFGWGEATSPVLHGDALAVNWDHEGKSRLYVLDARTGQTRWQVERDEVTTWNTPVIIDHKGTTQLIVSATSRARSYDLSTGKVLWECGGQTLNAIPSPVVAGGNAICMSGYRGTGAYAIPLDSTGDVSGTDRIAWHHDRGTPYVPSPLVYGDLLYFTQSNRATLTCLDVRTGRPRLDRVRLPGLRNLYASPVGAAGRIYFVGRDGTTLVIKHQPQLEVLATNRLDDPIDASPAIVGSEIFLRSATHLYCIAESK